MGIHDYYCFDIMGSNIIGFRSDINKPRVRGLIIGSHGWRGKVCARTHTNVCERMRFLFFCFSTYSAHLWSKIKQSTTMDIVNVFCVENTLNTIKKTYCRGHCGNFILFSIFLLFIFLIYRWQEYAWKHFPKGSLLW
jgi:hypothetical protein